MRCLLFLLSCFIFFSVQAQVYVKQDAKGANNGTSWKDAYINLDSALVRTNSGAIWVAAGTYKPSLPVVSNFYHYNTFTINKKIALYGGFIGTETNLLQRNINGNATILSGDVGVEGVNLDNTQTILSILGNNIDSTTIIDGFFITKSYYVYTSGAQTGTVYLSCAGNPVIKNCTIENNFNSRGAGIYIERLAGFYTATSPLIINNIIRNNTALDGGGIYIAGTNARIIGNKLFNNEANAWGGNSSTSYNGGAIMIESGTPYIANNLIDSNYSGYYGGGVSVFAGNEIPVISNNVISNNTSRVGGGVSIQSSSVYLVNNLIISNHSMYGGFEGGGGLYSRTTYNSQSVNNTIANNTSDGYGGAMYLEDSRMSFLNTIVYNNPTKFDSPVYLFNPNQPLFCTFNYCDVENGKYGITYHNNSGTMPSYAIDSIWKTGNISGDPKFADTASKNFQLLAQSPNLDSGIPDTSGLLLSDTDLAGHARILNGRIDIGCYEGSTQVLPVKLLSFTASLERAGSHINWTVDNNLDAANFELQKSSDGVFFSPLSVITSSAYQNSFSNSDNALIAGYNYYRLKVTDKSGHYFYSSVVWVFNKISAQLVVFPNPASDELHYTFIPGVTSSKYRLRIYSIEGKLLYESDIASANITSSVKVNFLSRGTYLFQILGNNKKFQSLFVKN